MLILSSTIFTQWANEPYPAIAGHLKSSQLRTAMGGHFSSETPLVVCYSGRCSHAFPLRVSADAARAASAAAMGSAMVATVVGYTTKLTKEASGRVGLSQ